MPVALPPKPWCESEHLAARKANSGFTSLPLRSGNSPKKCAVKNLPGEGKEVEREASQNQV